MENCYLKQYTYIFLFIVSFGVSVSLIWIQEYEFQTETVSQISCDAESSIFLWLHSIVLLLHFTFAKNSLFEYKLVDSILYNVKIVLPRKLFLVPSSFFIKDSTHLPFKAYCLRDAITGLTFNNCRLCPHCIYVFCAYLRTNSDLWYIHQKLVGFYNRDEKCLQHGTDLVVK